MDFGEKTCFANPGGSTLGVTPGGAARDEVLRREPSRLLTWKHFDLSPSEMALKSSKPPQNQEPRPALITPGDPPAPEGDKDPFFHRGRGAAQTHTSPVWNPPPPSPSHPDAVIPQPWQNHPEADCAFSHRSSEQLRHLHPTCWH